MDRVANRSHASRVRCRSAFGMLGARSHLGVSQTSVPRGCNISYVNAPRWLLLAHQLPTRPSNARVKTWRRLQQIGALPTRNSVYVLPNNEQCREDFEWLRSEIVALGGEATVFAAEPLDSAESGRLIEQFRRARTDNYRRLKRDSEKLLAAARRTRTP